MDEYPIIYFPSNGQIIASYLGKEKKTLLQIEQMTGYEVKPTGVVSNFLNGGYVIQESNGHGLVLSLVDLDTSGSITHENADGKCNELVLNGYNDWRLPTIEELESVYKYSFTLGLGNIKEALYWSSTMRKNDLYKRDMPLLFSMYNGKWAWGASSNWQNIMLARAVRSY